MAWMLFSERQSYKDPCVWSRGPPWSTNLEERWKLLQVRPLVCAQCYAKVDHRFTGILFLGNKNKSSFCAEREMWGAGNSLFAGVLGLLNIPHQRYADAQELRELLLLGPPQVLQGSPWKRGELKHCRGACTTSIWNMAGQDMETSRRTRQHWNVPRVWDFWVPVRKGIQKPSSGHASCSSPPCHSGSLLILLPPVLYDQFPLTHLRKLS